MADDVTALLSGRKKKKPKKHKRKRCRVVKRTKVVHGKRKTVKVRKCKPRKKAKPKPQSPVYQAPAFVPAPPVPPPPAPPRLKTIQSPIAVYQGAFGPAQATRLAWRAGFGPGRGAGRPARRAGPRGRRDDLHAADRRGAARRP